MNVEKVYVVAGLQRSGNHAIINWILGNQKSTTDICFLNNSKVYSDPLKSNQPNVLTKYSNKLGPNRGNIVLVSYEEKDLNEVFSEENLKLLAQVFGNTALYYKILVLRDPKNFLASRYIFEKGYIVDSKLKRKIKSAFIYFLCFLGLDSFIFKAPSSVMTKVIGDLYKRLSFNSFTSIPLIDNAHLLLTKRQYKRYCRYSLSDTSLMAISFSEWYESISYRKKAAYRLDLNSFSKTVEERAVRSNFSGDVINPNNRWKEFINDKFLMAAFRNRSLWSHYLSAIRYD